MITLRNRLNELGRLAEAVAAFARANGLSRDTANDVNLVLEEVITNIIRYGYEDDREHEIVVRGCLAHGELRLEVEDDARAFNPLQVPPPDTEQPLEERPVGGLGIHFVRRLMDHVSYRRRRNRNILTLRKTLATRDPAGAHRCGIRN